MIHESMKTWNGGKQVLKRDSDKIKHIYEVQSWIQRKKRDKNRYMGKISSEISVPEKQKTWKSGERKRDRDREKTRERERERKV
jgi:hypothetical protein